MSAPKKYPVELRDRAIRLVEDFLADEQLQLSVTGACSRVAEQLGINRDTLRGWVKQAQIDAGAKPGLASDDRRRLVQLERENRELRRANAILKTASAFFAAELDRSGGKNTERLWISTGGLWIPFRNSSANPIRKEDQYEKKIMSPDRRRNATGGPLAEYDAMNAIQGLAEAAAFCEPGAADFGQEAAKMWKIIDLHRGDLRAFAGALVLWGSFLLPRLTESGMADWVDERVNLLGEMGMLDDIETGPPAPGE